MTWKFRGGWEFSCTGKDTRVLAQAAKRSLAFNAENASKRHADIAAAVARKAAADAKARAEEINTRRLEDIQNLEDNKAEQSELDALAQRVWALESSI